MCVNVLPKYAVGHVDRQFDPLRKASLLPLVTQEEQLVAKLKQARQSGSQRMHNEEVLF